MHQLCVGGTWQHALASMAHSDACVCQQNLWTVSLWRALVAFHFWCTRLILHWPHLMPNGPGANVGRRLRCVQQVQHLLLFPSHPCYPTKLTSYPAILMSQPMLVIKVLTCTPNSNYDFMKIPSNYSSDTSTSTCCVGSWINVLLRSTATRTPHGLSRKKNAASTSQCSEKACTRMCGSELNQCAPAAHSDAQGTKTQLKGMRKEFPVDMMFRSWMRSAVICCKRAKRFQLTWCL